MLLLILVRFVLRDTTPFKVAVLFSSDTLYAFSTTFAALPIARPTESLVKISVTTNKNRSKPFSSTTAEITFQVPLGVQERRLYQQRLLVRFQLSHYPFGIL